MRLLIDDDEAPGVWNVVPAPTRQAELEAGEPSKVKMAAILMGIALDLLTSDLAGRPDNATAAPKLALPGVDFTVG